jgi:hypothetical protein
MAVTTYALERSTQIAKTLDPFSNYPGNPTRMPDDAGKLRYARCDFTQGVAAGDATSTFGLFLLPPGRWRFLNMKLDTSAFGASRTLDVGWLAHVDHNGVTVVADPNGLAAAKDVSAALVGWDFNVATAHVVLDTRENLLIVGTVAGGTVPAGATVKGHLTYGQAV